MFLFKAGGLSFLTSSLGWGWGECRVRLKSNTHQGALTSLESQLWGPEMVSLLHSPGHQHPKVGHQGNGKKAQRVELAR